MYTVNIRYLELPREQRKSSKNVRDSEKKKLLYILQNTLT